MTFELSTERQEGTSREKHKAEATVHPRGPRYGNDFDVTWRLSGTARKASVDKASWAQVGDEVPEFRQRVSILF